MAQLHAVLSVLAEGESVRRDEWEPIVRMFVSSEMLMCQCGDAKPWQHALTWDEISATDWEPIRATPAAQKASRPPAIPPPIQRVCVQAVRSSLSDAGVHRNSFLLWFLPNRRDI